MCNVSTGLFTSTSICHCSVTRFTINPGTKTTHIYYHTVMNVVSVNPKSTYSTEEPLLRISIGCSQSTSWVVHSAGTEGSFPALLSCWQNSLACTSQLRSLLSSCWQTASPQPLALPAGHSHGAFQQGGSFLVQTQQEVSWCRLLNPHLT